MIELHNISKSFEQREILKDINLVIQPGEFVVLQADDNGAGKTTLLNIILGILKPDQGEVKLCGFSPQDPESKIRVGVMRQEVGVPKNLRVRELIDLVRNYYADSLSTEEIINKVDLRKKSDAWANRGLSTGEKKRLELGLALANDPDILILDEPTASLAPKRCKEFWNLLKCCVTSNLTVLIVTNISSDLQELETLATRFITLQEGQLLDEKRLESDTEISQMVPVQEQEKPVVAQLQSWLGMFIAQIKAELLQLKRTPVYLVGLMLFCFLTSLISSPQYGALGLAFCGGLALLTFAIERVGKQIALERVEGWLKLLRVTPLRPTAYLAAKLVVTMIILAIILMLVLTLGALRTEGSVTIRNQFSLFFSLWIGVIPFVIAGSAMGYLIEPKSLDQVAGISIPIALFTCGLPIPWLSSDIIVISPFYHYSQIALWSIGSKYYDHHIFLHLLWLLTAVCGFSILAVWAYQRDQVLQ